MEHVKIFTAGTADEFKSLEDKVSEWLESIHGDFDVVSKHVTSAAGINQQGVPFVNCTIVIFYRHRG